jgi:transposase
MTQNAQAGRKKTLTTISTQNARSTTVGLDLGDRWSRYCVLNGSGDIIEENKVQTTAIGFEERFAAMSAARVVIEVGGHSPWVSRQLGSYAHYRTFNTPRCTITLFMAYFP